MNKDHDYQKMIAGILNPNTSDIETINVYNLYLTKHPRKGKNLFDKVLKSDI